MGEELLDFENTVEDEDGASWLAAVFGAERDDGHWIGWLRFTPAKGGEALETDRETTQPNRDDLSYWATGLTYFYLEGALSRARRKAERAAGGPAPDRRSGEEDRRAGSPPEANGSRTLETNADLRQALEP